MNRESNAQPIELADLALRELVDECAKLLILLDCEVVPLGPVTTLQVANVLARMGSAHNILVKSLTTGAPGPGKGPAAATVL